MTHFEKYSRTVQTQTLLTFCNLHQLRKKQQLIFQKFEIHIAYKNIHLRKINFIFLVFSIFHTTFKYASNGKSVK